MANVAWARAELPQLSRSEIITVDLDARRIHMPRDLLVPPLPGNKALHKALETPYKHLTKSFHSAVPYRGTPEQRTSAAKLVHLLEEHFFGPMFKRFKHHCVTNLTDNVTVFLKESYLAEETTADTADWFEAFLDTQIFQIFSDKRLREIDNFKPRQKLSLSMPASPTAPPIDMIELPQRLKAVVEGDDESQRGDIAWDEPSLVKPEDFGSDTGDDPSRKRGASVTNGGVTPRLQQRTGSATPRLLVDRGRSVSSSSFLNTANKVPPNSESNGHAAAAVSETLTPPTPFSPVRKPVIPPALRSTDSSPNISHHTAAQTEATTPSS